MLGLNLLKIPDDAVPETEYVRVATPEKYAEKQDQWLDRGGLAGLRASEEAAVEARRVLAEARGVPEDEIGVEDVDRYFVGRSTKAYTQFYRVAWRRQIAPDTERALYVALIPPGAAHINMVHSLTADESWLTALVAGFWSGLPVDYFLRTTGRGDLQAAGAKVLPAPAGNHPLASGLLLRTLRLNCLTSAYSALWAELYDPTWPAYEPWACKWPKRPRR